MFPSITLTRLNVLHRSHEKIITHLFIYLFSIVAFLSFLFFTSLHLFSFCVSGLSSDPPSSSHRYLRPFLHRLLSYPLSFPFFHVTLCGRSPLTPPLFFALSTLPPPTFFIHSPRLIKDIFFVNSPVSSFPHSSSFLSDLNFFLGHVCRSSFIFQHD